jgi:hypothetical protein
MTEPTYFIPEITEFYPGYEFEYRVKKIKPWTLTTLKFQHDVLTPFHGDPFSILQQYIDKDCLRVRFLDRELIELEGWKYVDTYTTMEVYEKNGINLVKDLNTNFIKIKHPVTQHHWYDGQCICVNTLRRISGLLNINL